VAVTGSVCKDEFADDPASGDELPAIAGHPAVGREAPLAGDYPHPSSGGAPRAANNALHRRFDEAQLVELAAAIAWENYRGRFNRVFGVRPVGFCEGAFCALPEH
jgi:hypothetical protein